MKPKIFTTMLFAAALCGCGDNTEVSKLTLAKDGKTEYTFIHEF